MLCRTKCSFGLLRQNLERAKEMRCSLPPRIHAHRLRMNGGFAKRNRVLLKMRAPGSAPNVPLDVGFTLVLLSVDTFESYEPARALVFTSRRR